LFPVVLNILFPLCTTQITADIYDDNEEIDINEDELLDELIFYCGKSTWSTPDDLYAFEN
jgi:hypothetical protein